MKAFYFVFEFQGNLLHNAQLIHSFYMHHLILINNKLMFFKLILLKQLPFGYKPRGLSGHCLVI